MKRCVFAGTFDPMTKGHEEILKKACAMFDEVLVALCVNPEKKAMFSVGRRLEFLNAVAGKYPNAKVVYHEGPLVDLMKKEGIKYTVRGVRDAADYEYEKKMDFFNAELMDDIVSVFLPCPVSLSVVSSSAVRELLAIGKSAEKFVPEEVADLLKKDIE